MSNENEFAILVIRQAALDDEASAARLADELAAELDIRGERERTPMTNAAAEGTEEVIRFPAVPQAALNTAIDASTNGDQIARFFIVPTP
jgi:hypothetical protein